MSDRGLRLLTSLQGKFVNVFDSILSEWDDCVEATAYVADSLLFDKVRSGLTHLTAPRHTLVCEWDVYAQTADAAKWERVQKFEREVLGQSLFKGIIVDRRHIFGRDCKSTQDYAPRFTTSVLEARLVNMAADVLDRFETVKPDACLSFGISNVQDYLIYRVARAKGVPFYQVRSAKIENFIAVFHELEGLPDWKDIPSTPEDLEIARRFVDEVEQKQNLYEGSIKRSNVGLPKVLRSALAGIRNDLRKACNSVYRSDNQVEWLFKHNLRMELVNKLKWKRQAKRFFRHRPMQGSEESGTGLSFFFPMHFEPEVAIQFFGPSYLNQIELIRNIAMNLPMGAELLIREHPRSFGFRSDGYYRKLAEIPRVKLLHPSISMVEALQLSDGVFSISGSTALEGVIKGKPAWVFGRPYFVDIDPLQICHVTEMDRLDKDIIAHLRHYRHDRAVIENFVSKIIGMSVRFNLYTEALAKSGRNQAGDSSGTIGDFATHLMGVLRGEVFQARNR